MTLRKSLMRYFIIFILGITFLSNLVFSDCIDDQEYEFSFEKYLEFLIYGKPVLEATPQKMTKTLQGINFTSDYDNGSLVDVTSAGTNIFNCTIYTEPGALGSAIYWFRFKMTGVAGRTVTLNIDHSNSPRPVISLDGIIWRRLSDSEAPSLSQVVLTFGAMEDSAELAFFYPLGMSETYQKVSDLVTSTVYANSQVIGQSYQGQDMLMVTVTNTSVSDTDKHRVWVHSRAHSGEVTSTHVLLGFLEQIVENSIWGERLRRYCIFNIVPLENVDGVFLGHTRWDSQGLDPERGWGDPVTLPEVLNIKNQVDAFMAGSNPIEVSLNLHSTYGNYIDTFFWKHLQPSVTTNFEVIEQNYIDDFNITTNLFDNLNPQTSQLHPYCFIESYFWNNWGENVMAMTHEGHFRKRITDDDWITADDYKLLGRAMAIALIDYLNLPDSTGISYWMYY